MFTVVAAKWTCRRNPIGCPRIPFLQKKLRFSGNSSASCSNMSSALDTDPEKTCTRVVWILSSSESVGKNAFHSSGSNPCVGHFSNFGHFCSCNFKNGSCRQQKNIHEFATRVVRVRLGETVVVTIHDEPLSRVETACSTTVSGGHSAVEVASYAREFAHGRWSSPGPRDEEKWYGTSDKKPKGNETLSHTK